MHIYSRNDAVLVISSCTDHMFLVLTLLNTATAQIQATRLHGQPSFLQIPILGLLLLNSFKHTTQLFHRKFNFYS